MAVGHGGYAKGDQAWGHCERCSDRLLLKNLRYDGQYPDLLVCADCWDPKHPQEYLPPVTDPVTLYDPTGDQDRFAANALEIPLFFEDFTGAYPLSVAATLNATRYNVIAGSGIVVT